MKYTILLISFSIWGQTMQVVRSNILLTSPPFSPSVFKPQQIPQLILSFEKDTPAQIRAKEIEELSDRLRRMHNTPTSMADYLKLCFQLLELRAKPAEPAHFDRSDRVLFFAAHASIAGSELQKLNKNLPLAAEPVPPAPSDLHFCYQPHARFPAA